MKTLLKNLQDLYGMPYSSDPEAAFGVLKDQLSGFSDELSRRALQIILSKQKNQSFPAASIILQAVQAAAAEADKTQRLERPRQPARRDANAKDLIRSDMGRTAADQGWIAQLWSFCDRNGRLPNPGEQAKLMMQARQYEELYDETKQKLANGDFTTKPRSFDSWIALGDVTGEVLKHHVKVLEDGLRKREEYASMTRGSE